MDAPHTPPAMTLRCPAKLNLTLAVAAPREDGLHPIASIMTALDFGDDMQLRTLPEGPSTFTRRFADDAPKPTLIDWPIERDLAYRAHALLQHEAGRPLPIDCVLNKRIPAGAGLGGGSSNAAGMLVGLRELFAVDIHDEQLIKIGSSLGADVAFAVTAMLGKRAALVTGIGEAITPFDSLPGMAVVLVFPDGACPTAEVYRTFDRLNPQAQRAVPEGLVRSWVDTQIMPTPHNDLTHAAVAVCPAIKHNTDQMAELGLEPRLTGSGSCLFAVVHDAVEAQTAAKTLQSRGINTYPASYTSGP